MPYVVALSLLSAFLFASAATIQQRATRGAAAASTQAERRYLTALLPILGLLRQLARSRLWLLGWLTNLLGFLLQAVALHLGSVALVQPLLVTQLLFTLPLVSIMTQRWPLLRDWLAAAAICGGVAVFLSVRGAAPAPGAENREQIILACLVSLAVIGGLVLAAGGKRTSSTDGNVEASVHAAPLAVAAGLCFAVSAVMIKLTATDLIERGVAATAVDWPGYALAASTVTGLLLGQQAFATGPLPVAVAAMNITNPLASYLIGIFAFHVDLPSGAGQLAAVAASGFLLFVGASMLAGSPNMSHPPPAPAPPPPAATDRPPPATGGEHAWGRSAS